MEEGLLSGKRREGSWAAETREGRRLGCLAAPLIMVTMSQFLVRMISSMVVGHNGELALSGASIATSLSNVTGFSVIKGMASGLETLSGQAYGARQYHKLGIQLHRAILCLLLICIPISILWLNLGKLMVLIEKISRETARYIVWLIPSLFAFAIVQPLMKFLQAQSLFFPMLYAAILTLCFHVPFCWALVFQSGMGTAGAALANSVSYWLNVLILVLYVVFSDSCKSTRALPSMEIFQGICEFLRIGIPSAVMMCLEWWSFELLVLLSGRLPNPKLETSVLSICLNMTAALYALPDGFGTATSTRVSNELGAGNPHRAHVAVRVGVMVAVSEALTVSLTIFLLRHKLGYAYSGEKEVVDYVERVVPLLSISIIMDSIQGLLSRIARGCGWQHLGAYINLGAFYLFGIPIAAVLGFLLQLRGEGLWIGILCGSTMQTALLSLVTLFTNWEQQAANARERVCSAKHGEQKTFASEAAHDSTA